MPSYTSSSSEAVPPASGDQHQRYDGGAASRTRIVIIAIAILLSVALLEAGTRFAFDHVSKIERRVKTEHDAAVAIRHVAGESSLLIVGNSLPLMAVDMDLLKRSLPPNVRPYRFVIESTQLFDWKYGLRRLFADGARPDVIVIAVGATYVLPTAIRGDYSSFYLFRTTDIAEIADTLGYDNTRRSNLYFARYSRFFAGRSPLRNFVLNRVDRPYGDLLHAIGTVSRRKSDPAAVEAAARTRLSELQTLAATYGARIVLLIPPGFARPEELGVLQGASDVGVPVVHPIPQNAWNEEMYSDGFHLNAKGAEEFTKRLAPQLADLIVTDASARQPACDADCIRSSRQPK